jgi:hypothetical protein
MSILNKIYRKSLLMFGDIKIFPWPMFILYHPEGYGMRGEDVRNVLNIIEEGDMVLRGYNHYLDGYFIPGQFSHAGYYAGDNMIIHSMGEGVMKEDIINFCRCDYMAIMRFRDVTKSDIYTATVNAENLIGLAYDFEFEHEDDEYYCTEMVVKAWEHKSEELNIQPTTVKALFGLIKKDTITPDQFWNAPSLDVVYSSAEVLTDI